MDNPDQKNYELIPSSKKDIINASPLVSRGLDLAKNITGVSKYKASLLWVDDESDLLSFGKAFLGKKGYKVVTFENGFDALEEIKSNNYDLLITDLNHFRINGIELLEKVQELKPQLMTMVVSGVESEEIVAKTMALGCVAYLHKPVILDQLTATIEKVLRIKRGNIVL